MPIPQATLATLIDPRHSLVSQIPDDEERDMSRESRRHGDREERRTAGDEKTSDQARRAAGPKRTSPAQFLREVRSELRKVAWPSRKEVVSYTLVVLVTTTVLVGIVYGMDFVIREAVINTLTR